MAMEGAFKAQLVSIFGADTKFEKWLETVGIQTAKDFSLITSKERLVAGHDQAQRAYGDQDEEISKPAKAKGVPMEIKDDTTASSGQSDLTEFDKGLPDKTRKSCEQLFLSKHGYYSDFYSEMLMDMH